MTGPGALLLLAVLGVPRDEVGIRVTASAEVLAKNEVLQLGFHFPARPDRAFA